VSGGCCGGRSAGSRHQCGPDQCSEGREAEMASERPQPGRSSVPAPVHSFVGAMVHGTVPLPAVGGQSRTGLCRLGPGVRGPATVRLDPQTCRWPPDKPGTGGREFEQHSPTSDDPIGPRARQSNGDKRRHLHHRAQPCISTPCFCMHLTRGPGPEPLLAEATLNGPANSTIPIDYRVNRCSP
jgi:hypothetical protein